MRTLLLSAAVMALGFATVPAQAAVNTPVPTANYITVNGLDWAWASPCAATGGCGDVDFSFQGTLGWRIPTLEEFLARPDYTAFNGACASAWFSPYSHCDVNDGATGFIFDYGYNVLPNGSNGYSESWVVRDVVPGVGGVPEAATWAMMIAGFGLVGAAMRRRTLATA